MLPHLTTQIDDALPMDRPGPGESLQAFTRRHYGPHSGQSAFCDDPARYRAAVAGIGGGKTEVGAFDAIRHAVRFPGIKGLVVAPSYRMLTNATLPTIRLVISWWEGLEYTFHKSDWRIEFPQLRNAHGEPSSLTFGYAANPDSLRGGTYGFAWLDEAALCPEAAWRELSGGRIRQPGYPHRAWCTTTPRGKNWVYRTFAAERETWDEQRAEAYSLHQWTTLDNPAYHADPQDIPALQAAYGGTGSDFYRQEVLAQFLAFTGLVYRAFDEGLHVCAKVPCRLRRIVAGIDWGVTSPGCIIVIGEGEDGKLYVLEEVYERGLLISGDPNGNDWLTVAKDLRTRHNITQFFADPEDANAILTFQRAGLPVAKADNRRLPGVRAVQAVIGGDSFRVLDAQAPNLLAEFSQYHWRETADGTPLEDQDPAKEFDHSMDALRYAVMGLERPQTTLIMRDRNDPRSRRRAAAPSRR